MFSDLTPLQTHLIEIIVMLVGAFLIGFLTAWFIQRVRLGKRKVLKPDAESIAQANEKIERLQEELRKVRDARQGD